MRSFVKILLIFHWFVSFIWVLRKMVKSGCHENFAALEMMPGTFCVQQPILTFKMDHASRSRWHTVINRGLIRWNFDMFECFCFTTTWLNISGIICIDTWYIENWNFSAKAICFAASNCWLFGFDPAVFFHSDNIQCIVPPSVYIELMRSIVQLHFLIVPSIHHLLQYLEGTNEGQVITWLYNIRNAFIIIFCSICCCTILRSRWQINIDKSCFICWSNSVFLIDIAFIFLGFQSWFKNLLYQSTLESRSGYVIYELLATGKINIVMTTKTIKVKWRIYGWWWQHGMVTKQLTSIQYVMESLRRCGQHHTDDPTLHWTVNKLTHEDKVNDSLFCQS